MQTVGPVIVTCDSFNCLQVTALKKKKKEAIDLSCPRPCFPGFRTQPEGGSTQSALGHGQPWGLARDAWVCGGAQGNWLAD